MGKSELISQRGMLVQANERGELLPPGRKLLPTLVCNDGALGANAASVTE